ncbi:NACHT domain-containing protein [Candidatus Magnetaquicoccus inordinatus]|uniref:NACHT domain-containing protein n=1 Tax=Candidatus Magnetaquicoccus inordinatus TaxID=2496818 RepID=UPI00102AD2F7|nr:hypothetical protein [Candidatus Magnetaquicoccus inordinatus]
MSSASTAEPFIVPRLFSRITSDEQTDTTAQPSPLSAFFSEAAFVLLGEPGMGKTECFIQAAREEKNAHYYKVRAFLRNENKDEYADKVLYLDGLDEQRAKESDGRAILDRIIGKLKDLDNPRFRLSCRTADWYGENDQTNLQDASASNKITVVQLHPLSSSDIEQIVTKKGLSAGEFMQQAQEHGIEEWLNNPYSLNLLLTVVGDGKTWPNSRRELFRKASEILINEHNDEHRRTGTNFAANRLLQASGLLCLIILRTDLEGVALNEKNAGEGFIAINHFPENDLPLSEAARRKLFRHPGPEQAVYMHRTMAEYLAAQFLAQRMAEGLPAERVRRLLTSNNGKVPSFLRGLHAWVASLSVDPALFIRNDPLGVIYYGDPAEISTTNNNILLDQMEFMDQENQWLLRQVWKNIPLGRLSDCCLQKSFTKILQEPNKHSHVFVDIILQIIRHGKEISVSAESLLTFIKQNNHSKNYLLKYAAMAFVKHYPDRLEELLPILDELELNPDKDKEHELRGVLLQALYPGHLTLDQLCIHLPHPKPRFIGSYYIFLSYELVKNTSKENLYNLANILLQKTQHTEPDDGIFDTWKALACEAIITTLEQNGENIPIDTLFEWLLMHQNDETTRCTLIDINTFSSRLHTWLSARPETVKELFLLWINSSPPARPEQHIYTFWYKLINYTIPNWFPDWCLEQSAHYPNADIAKMLFLIGAKELLKLPLEQPPQLVRLFNFIEQNSQFKEFVDLVIANEITVFHLRMKSDELIRTMADNQRKEEMINYLTNRLEGIREGSDYETLLHLARIYHADFHYAARNLAPRERIKVTTNERIALAAEQGLLLLGRTIECPTPNEIGKLEVENMRDYRLYIIRACVDLTYETGQNIFELPEATLQAAICFRMRYTQHNEKPQWLSAIIQEKPDLAAKACREFWLPQLQQNKSHISTLWQITNGTPWHRVAQRVAIPLLQECPDLINEHLQPLLSAAIHYGDKEELLKLAKAAISRFEPSDDRWPLWAATAFLLDQTVWPQLQQHILPVNPDLDPNKNDLYMQFLSDVSSFYKNNKLSDVIFPVAAYLLLVNTFGKYFIPPSFELDHDNISYLIQNMIDKIGTIPTQEASEALRTMADNPELEKWHNRIRYTLASHQQVLTDKLVESKYLHDIFNVVMNGAPTSAGDLFALVVDQIRTIADELRHGNTDGYKIFWNINSHSQPTEPIPEEDGRNRFLDKLRVKLQPLQIVAEPEGHYADEKRADIQIQFNSWRLPIEIKRHFHREIWRAAKSQLIDKYVRDPKTYGYGIYLVFWYGEPNKWRLPTPPANITRPSSASELEQALLQTLPEQNKEQIEVIVLDLTSHSPLTTREKEKTARMTPCDEECG